MICPVATRDSDLHVAILLLSCLFVLAWNLQDLMSFGVTLPGNRWKCWVVRTDDNM